MVDVFGFGVDGLVLADFVEASLYFVQFLFGEDSGAFEGIGVGGAGLEFEGEQAAVVGERALPLFEFGIEGLAEAAGPHFHCATLPENFCRPFGAFLS